MFQVEPEIGNCLIKSIISNHIFTNISHGNKVFVKHIHLVISQLLGKIFQPFKEQKWCPSLSAPNLSNSDLESLS